MILSTTVITLNGFLRICVCLQIGVVQRVCLRWFIIPSTRKQGSTILLKRLLGTKSLMTAMKKAEHKIGFFVCIMLLVILVELFRMKAINLVMIDGRRIASELSTEVGDKVWPCRGKSFECDVNELLVGHQYRMEWSWDQLIECTRQHHCLAF